MKLIISSKVAEKLASRISNHLKSVSHQPITLDVDFLNNDEVDIKIVSVEGNMTFNVLVEAIK